MTLSQAKRLLPKGTEGLVRDISTVSELRYKVADELRYYRAGTNPLNQRQVEGLYAFLQKTEV